MIKLRDYKEEDATVLALLANNENVSRYMTNTFPYPYTIEDAMWWISTGSKKGITKVIEFNGEFVGTAGAVPKEGERSRTAVIGYWIGEPYWGRGIACEALKNLTALIFDTTNIVRIEASIYSQNSGSMRVAEKAGYIHEAILEKAIFKNSEYYNEHIYSKVTS